MLYVRIDSLYAFFPTVGKSLTLGRYKSYGLMTLCNHEYITEYIFKCKQCKYLAFTWYKPVAVLVQKGRSVRNKEHKKTISSCASKKYSDWRRKHSDSDTVITALLCSPPSQ